RIDELRGHWLTFFDQQAHGFVDNPLPAVSEEEDERNDTEWNRGERDCFQNLTGRIPGGLSFENLSRFIAWQFVHQLLCGLSPCRRQPEHSRFGRVPRRQCQGTG